MLRAAVKAVNKTATVVAAAAKAAAEADPDAVIVTSTD